MIDVRLQSLKPPAIQYASVQPQSTQQMTSRMGCCVLEGSSTCVGDIGSPLMMPEGGGRFFSQAGLLSWSLGCGREEAPTVFTRCKSCKTFHQQVPHIFQQVMI